MFDCKAMGTVQRFDYRRGLPGLRALRDYSSELSDVTSLGTADGFWARHTAQHMGAAILLDVQTSALRYERTALHIARS